MLHTTYWADIVPCVFFLLYIKRSKDNEIIEFIDT